MIEIRNIILPIILVICYIFIRLIYCRIKHKKIDIKNEFINTAFVCYIGLLISFLITYNLRIFLVENAGSPLDKIKIVGGFQKLINIIPFKTISEQLRSHSRTDYINIIVNLLIMIPFPIFIKHLNPKINVFFCLLITLIVVVIIEIIQYFIGRSCDIDDVILNMLGAGAGLYIYCVIKKHKKS